MYKEELNELSKETLVEICDNLLSELRENGTYSNNYILTIIKENERREEVI